MPRVKKPTNPAVVASLTTPEALAEHFKDYPAIDVLSRRFTDPKLPGSLPILLKGESPDSCMNSDHQRQVQASWTTCKVRDQQTGKRCGKPVRKWFIYTANTGIENRWSVIKQLGYVPVEVDELLDSLDVSGLVEQPEKNGRTYVRRGDHGKEITMKIPLVARNYIKDLEAAQRAARMKSKRAQREDLANAIGSNADLGSERDEVAEGVYHGRGIQIETMRHERTTLGDEAEAE